VQLILTGSARISVAGGKYKECKGITGLLGKKEWGEYKRERVEISEGLMAKNVARVKK